MCNINKPFKIVSDTSAGCIQLHTLLSPQQSLIIKKLLATAFAQKSERCDSDYQQQPRTALLHIVFESCKTQEQQLG